jgi:hypothetical protein
MSLGHYDGIFISSYCHLIIKTVYLDHHIILLLKHYDNYYSIYSYFYTGIVTLQSHIEKMRRSPHRISNL